MPRPLAEASSTWSSGIVDNPEDVSVSERSGRGRGTLLKVTVHPDDLGRVIGRAGRTAKSLRTVVNALSGGQNVRVDFVDVNGR
ncbi:MAG: KH domain-containing protein [Micrococcales bacterium]|nr:KH domain-containing protein [Micrococcales bacterium]